MLKDYSLLYCWRSECFLCKFTCVYRGVRPSHPSSNSVRCFSLVIDNNDKSCGAVNNCQRTLIVKSWCIRLAHVSTRIVHAQLPRRPFADLWHNFVYRLLILLFPNQTEKLLTKEREIYRTTHANFQSPLYSSSNCPGK